MQSKIKYEVDKNAENKMWEIIIPFGYLAMFPIAYLYLRWKNKKDKSNLQSKNEKEVNKKWEYLNGWIEILKWYQVVVYYF